MPLYFDADAVVKRYLDEGDGATPILDAIFSSPLAWGGLSSSEWILPEVTAALAKKYREGRIKKRQFIELVADFRAEAGSVMTLVVVGSGNVESASLLIQDHAETRFHAGDALHLHTATSLRSDIGLGSGEPFVFVTCDRGLLTLAARRGIQTFNPATQDFTELQAVFGK